jgi:hypothetical protein
VEDIGAEADDGDDKYADDDVETIAVVQETALDMLWDSETPGRPIGSVSRRWRR